MGPTNIGDLTGHDLETLLLALVIALVVWIFNRERNELVNDVRELFASRNNHAQRLTKIDGQIEDK